MQFFGMMDDMRSIFGIALILSLALAGTYYGQAVFAVCAVPLTYSLGELDEQFNLSSDEAKAAIAEAVAIWEEGTGLPLFEEQEGDTDIVINFVFDERQEMSDAERSFAERLAESKDANQTLVEMYDALVAEYDEAVVVYEEKKAIYERDLNRYNATVEQYNDDGGAPPEAYDELETERRRLNDESKDLAQQADTLNEYVEQINTLSQRGNEIIADINNNVEIYNDRFAKPREFTQGDYQAGTIQIYTFESREELVAVLVHELGHALSIDHVENELSMMYYLMDQQTKTLVLSEEDKAAFVQQCADGTFMGRLLSRWNQIWQ